MTGHYYYQPNAPRQADDRSQPSGTVNCLGRPRSSDISSLYASTQPQRHSPLARNVFMASELSDCESERDSAAASRVTHRGLRTRYKALVAPTPQPPSRSSWPVTQPEAVAPYSKPARGPTDRITPPHAADPPFPAMSRYFFMNPSPEPSGYAKKLPRPPGKSPAATAIIGGLGPPRQPEPVAETSFVPAPQPASRRTSDPMENRMLPSALGAPVSSLASPQWTSDSSPEMSPRTSPNHVRLGSLSEAEIGTHRSVSPRDPNMLTRRGRYPLTSTPVQDDSVSSQSSPSPNASRVNSSPSPYPSLPPTPNTFESTVMAIPHSFVTNLGASTLSSPWSEHGDGASPKRLGRPGSEDTLAPNKEPSPSFMDSGHDLSHISKDPNDSDSMRHFCSIRDKILRMQLNQLFSAIPHLLIALGTLVLIAGTVGVFSRDANITPKAPSPSPKRLDLSAGWEIGYLVLASSSVLVSIVRLSDGTRGYREYRIPTLRRVWLTIATDMLCLALWGALASVIMFAENSYVNNHGRGLRANACRLIKYYDYHWHFDPDQNYMDLPLICTFTTLAACFGFVMALGHLVSIGLGLTLVRLVYMLRTTRGMDGDRPYHRIDAPANSTKSFQSSQLPSAAALVSTPSPLASFSLPLHWRFWGRSNRVESKRYSDTPTVVASVRGQEQRQKAQLIAPKPNFLTESESMDPGIEVQPLSQGDSMTQGGPDGQMTPGQSAAGTAAAQTLVRQLQRRAPRAHVYPFGHPDKGVESDSEDEAALGIGFDLAEDALHHRHGPITVNPVTFYDESYAQAVASQFAHHCNVHELLNIILQAYEAVGVPGTYDIIFRFHMLSTIYPAPAGQDLDHEITAYDDACSVWKYLELLLGDAVETGDENAVRFLAKAYQILNELVEPHILSRISELIVDYQTLVPFATGVSFPVVEAITEMLHGILQDYGTQPVNGDAELIEDIVSRVEQESFSDLASVFIGGLYTNRAMIHYHRMEQNFQISELTRAIEQD
ncbi:hypothetical protein H4R34_001954 [Dimargaris verticillata]|uniref:Uncharacterized protein n=1 Tax=Dimargaris verticillata TaxID=2761393 RepID=A0A9W8B8X3_9FUNG|nr:hypothetical protein H4R34_001954 [Dimargaris verticillata]